MKYFNLLSWRNGLLSLAGDRRAEAHSSTATPTIASVFGDEQPAKINDEVYALHDPDRPTLEVVFFHGLEFGDYQDSYWRNWLCADDSHCWPKTWLVGDWPDARVLLVAYDSSLTKTSTTGRVDLYQIIENFKFSLDDARVGQKGCPVVFVGHSLGGVVMKALCVRAKQAYPACKKRRRGDLMESFVDNLKGLFFLATPHYGSVFSDRARSSLAGPLMNELKVLDSQSARLNQDFGQFLDHHPSIKLWGVAESQPTRLGQFFDMVVPEGSARFLKYSEYYTASADHFGVCKPESKQSSTYKFLTRFLRDVTNEVGIHHRSRLAIKDDGCPSRNKWRKLQQIGRGFFGAVHRAMKDDGSFFAVKVSHDAHIPADFQQEIEFLSTLRHPNIIRYFGTAVEDGHPCIFLELMQDSLQSIIELHRLDETVISTYTRQILQGLQYVHEKNIILWDIKCANVLVDKDGQVKLANFGLAKKVGITLATSSKRTPYFMAPEVLKPAPGGYGPLVDIWSLGCTVLQMAEGKAPWSELEGFAFEKGELPPIPQHLSSPCQNFIRRCLQIRPEARPSASDLLLDPFVANALANVISM